ncbi:unnamed protein product [Tuber melanosporum]|uniref:Succinate dehydrogenase assembly factor 3 n=1 Tax=Tuber melanosporum (strain Mel28) TaxID=656061 RepID=D5G946_TUBMM|nr:uncharacterized protein GSTUM_00003123001 [Tuber melanosporum]CAZ81039.1 unnamed protein product [Tuber melanosporum]
MAPSPTTVKLMFSIFPMQYDIHQDRVIAAFAIVCDRRKPPESYTLTHSHTSFYSPPFPSWTKCAKRSSVVLRKLFPSHSYKTLLALLPPIKLYRRLLRAHRHKLSPEKRVLGDEYVKAEFRRHRDIENPLYIVGFLKEWQLYAQAVEGETWKDEKLEEGKLEKMSDQQIAQLYELMRAIKRGDTDAGGEGEGRL